MYQHPAYEQESYERTALLPFCAPHAKLLLVPSFDIPSRAFEQADQDEGGRLELHRDVRTNPTTLTQDEFLHLYYYPRHSSEPVIDKPLSAHTEIYQESFANFLLRIPNDFHCEDVPSSEQDPGVFDIYRLQFYASLEGNYEGQLTGEYAKEFDSDYSIRTWGDFIDRLARIFHQYTTFLDPSLQAALNQDMYYNQQQWPDEKAALRQYDGIGGSSSNVPSYDPSTYKEKDQGRLMFVDEATGSPVLNMEGAQVQTQGIQPGVKDPVEIILPAEGSDGKVIVRPADYLADAQNPAYANSSIVSTAIAASHFIVTTSEYISKAMLSGADTFTKKVKPNTTPVSFSPATHNRVQQFHTFSHSAAKFSSKAVHTVTKYAQNMGATVAGKGERGPRDPNKKPGILNKSMIAFGTVADGIDHSVKNLLHNSAGAVTTMVGHKYGDEARQVAHGLSSSVRNVGLVYVDASGVSRRAVIKSVAKGMVVGKVRKENGGQEELIVYGGNGSDYDEKRGFPSSSNSNGDVLPPYEPGSYDPSKYQEKPSGSGFSQLAPSQAYQPRSSSPATLGALPGRSVSPGPAGYNALPGYGPQDSSASNLGVRGLQHQGSASGRSSPVPQGSNPFASPPPPKY